MSMPWLPHAVQILAKSTANSTAEPNSRNQTEISTLHVCGCNTWAIFQLDQFSHLTVPMDKHYNTRWHKVPQAMLAPRMKLWPSSTSFGSQIRALFHLRCSHIRTYSRKRGAHQSCWGLLSSSNQAAAMFNQGVPQPEHGKQHSQGSVVLPLPKSDPYFSLPRQPGSSCFCWFLFQHVPYPSLMRRYTMHHEYHIPAV